jgi:hypothetical protein
LGKQCSFCEFASDDVAAFGEHMRDVHQWDRLASPRPARSSWRSLMFGSGGAVLALALTFLGLRNAEQSCLSQAAHGYCGDVWLGLIGAPVFAVIGFVVGFVIAEWTKPKVPKTEETN